MSGRSRRIAGRPGDWSFADPSLHQPLAPLRDGVQRRAAFRRHRALLDSDFLVLEPHEQVHAVWAVGLLGQQLPVRSATMGRLNLGVTNLYNRVHDPAYAEAGIVAVREAHVALDGAVAEAYGWADLLNAGSHGHHLTTRFGVRWTVAPEVQREVERRLLALNHERARRGGEVPPAAVPADADELEAV